MIARLASFIAVALVMGFLWFAILMPRPAPTGVRTDAIVVLTGSPGRIERGVALLESGTAKRLLISGVGRDTGRGDVARVYGITPDMMRCCVDLGRAAIDTRSNAIETSAWVARNGYRSVRFITTDWHMRRARFELAQQLTGDVQIIVDAVPSRPALADLVREYGKYLVRRAAGLVGI
jgi:uncharacterized SAM-binding protein YcdF (DUF218 family)